MKAELEFIIEDQKPLDTLRPEDEEFWKKYGGDSVAVDFDYQWDYRPADHRGHIDTWTPDESEFYINSFKCHLDGLPRDLQEAVRTAIGTWAESDEVAQQLIERCRDDA